MATSEPLSWRFIPLMVASGQLVAITKQEMDTEKSSRVGKAHPRV